MIKKYFLNKNKYDIYCKILYSMHMYVCVCEIFVFIMV